jgi:hypothetical protein
MSKRIAGFLVAATAVVGFASAANADVLYINSDGSMSNISTDVMVPSTTVVTPTLLPTTTTQVITQPAVIDTTPVIQTPVVQTQPVLIDRERRHLLDIGLPGLFGIHLF